MAQTSADRITETVGSWPIATREGAERGIELFRLSYQRALRARRG